MPAPKSVLADITDHDLNPEQPHTNLLKSGRLAQSDDVVDVVAEPTQSEPVKVEKSHEQTSDDKKQVEVVSSDPKLETVSVTPGGSSEDPSASTPVDSDPVVDENVVGPASDEKSTEITPDDQTTEKSPDGSVVEPSVSAKGKFKKNKKSDTNQ